MENQKNINNKIAENCSEESLKLIEKAFRDLNNDKINAYVISLDGTKLDFLDNPSINSYMADTIMEQYRAKAKAGMFFNTSLLLEIMGKNGVEKSLDGKSIEELQNFLDKTIKEDEYSINKNGNMAGTLREVCYETKKSDKANIIVIFLRNMDIAVLQEEINDYFHSNISLNARYSLRLFSDNKLCTYKNIFRRTITSPSDFENLDLTTDEAVAEYINNINNCTKNENDSPEQPPVNPRPSLRR